MALFGLGWMEIVVICIVAFLVLKPEDVPRIMFQMGSYYGKWRRLSTLITDEFLEIAELGRSLQGPISNPNPPTGVVTHHTELDMHRSVSPSDADVLPATPEVASRSEVSNS